jgi:hypothetical protein
MWDLEEEKTSKEREYFSLYKGFRVISPRLKKKRKLAKIIWLLRFPKGLGNKWRIKMTVTKGRDNGKMPKNRASHHGIGRPD